MFPFLITRNRRCLNNINFKIQCGQRIGIVGPTGGGKSTIVGLIARFYDPTSGRVLIDGEDITEFRLDALRDQIGFVLQDTALVLWFGQGQYRLWKTGCIRGRNY